MSILFFSLNINLKHLIELYETYLQQNIVIL